MIENAIAKLHFKTKWVAAIEPQAKHFAFSELAVLQGGLLQCCIAKLAVNKAAIDKAAAIQTNT